MKGLYNFIISSVVSGLTWDMIKGVSLNVITEIIRKILVKTKGGDILEQLREVAINLPAENKKSKKVFIKKLRSDKKFKSILFSQNINIVGSYSSIYLNILSNKKWKIFLLALLTVCILVFVFYRETHGLFNDKNENILENEYVTGKYNGLERLDMDSLPSQHMDTYIYSNKKEYEKGNYIRITKFMIDTGTTDYLKKEQPELYTTTFNAQFSTCSKIYAADHLHQDTSSVEGGFIEDEQGVFFTNITQKIYNEYIGNTVVYRGIADDGSDYFLLIRCLFVEHDGMMVVILSHHGVSYESFINSGKKDFVKMRESFYSFKQVRYNLLD